MTSDDLIRIPADSATSYNNYSNNYIVYSNNNDNDDINEYSTNDTVRMDGDNGNTQSAYTAEDIKAIYDSYSSVATVQQFFSNLTNAAESYSIANAG